MKPIPPAILHAFTIRCGTSPDALSFVGGGEDFSDGILFRYSRGTDRYILKILPVPLDRLSLSTEATRNRLQYVHYLARHGVAIAAPVPDPNGSLFLTETDGADAWLAYVMEEVAGTHPVGRDLTPAFAARFGHTVGKLHAVSKQYTREQDLSLAPDAFMGWLSEWKGFYDISDDPDIKAAWINVRDRLSALPRTTETYGFTHNDTHVFNLLQTPEDLVFIDFDVARCHWYAVDIPTAMQYTLFTFGGMDRPWTDTEPHREFFTAFMEGYTAETNLDVSLAKELDSFLQYRRLLMFTVMNGSMHGRPEDRAAWKNLILKQPPLLSKFL